MGIYIGVEKNPLRLNPLIINSEDVLTNCHDLNVLAEVWLKQGYYHVDVNNMLDGNGNASVMVLLNNAKSVGWGYFPPNDINKFKEAVFYATAEALKAKEK